MDGSHKNVEPHRPTQVHLLVDSMESTAFIGLLFMTSWKSMA